MGWGQWLGRVTAVVVIAVLSPLNSTVGWVHVAWTVFLAVIALVVAVDLVLRIVVSRLGIE